MTTTESFLESTQDDAFKGLTAQEVKLKLGAVKIKNDISIDSASLEYLASQVCEELRQFLTEEWLELDIYKSLLPHIHQYRDDFTDAELAVELQKAARFSMIAVEQFREAKVSLKSAFPVREETPGEDE
ncbi:MAG: hypothetical protein F6K40_29365 [Okeania sp. SIO3I5]|uniref:hypothetical protein n=1 Tax=Okeania sp. SIO3I5 TaxID=2607805 RepID=UPI0013B9BD28|nr:hypothetical protein [Okeania sp. SIO3I5]NEQ40129.1 hypothetical protein [Okeania sp. SIO3I5]